MEHGAEMWRTARRAITAAAIIGGVYFLAVRPIERAVSHAGAGVERGLQQALAALTHGTTRVVEGRAEITRTSEISELSLLEMRMSTTRSIEKSDTMLGLPLGTKKLAVRGNFKVKGGYRLTDGVSLHLENGQPVARFPKPEILSVELVDYEVLSEDSGWLNRIQPDDRARILRELGIQMRVDATQSGMLDTVGATLHQRLSGLLGVDSVRIEPTLP